MSWRRVTRAEQPALETILRCHPDQTMFIRANLDSDGLDTDAPRGMRLWWDGANIIGLSNAGVCFPIGPANPDWSAARPALRGLSIGGFLGPADWVAGFVDAVGMQDAPTRIQAAEPHFALRLDDLAMPDCTGFRLTPITEDQRATATSWRAAYLVETMGFSACDAPARATQEIADYIARDSHRLLWRGDGPAAMTGFNAVVGDCVQIGGVYTPPRLRGRGHARRAVALHLSEARRNGKARSVLTAANSHAARAYTAIGFRQIGAFAFHILTAPLSIA